MSLSVFYYCVCTFLCLYLGFNLSLSHLLPFLLSNVAVSMPCHLSEFNPWLKDEKKESCLTASHGLLTGV